eukprot:82404_1
MSVGFNIENIDDCQTIDVYVKRECERCNKQYQTSWSLQEMWSQSNYHLDTNDLKQWLNKMIPHWPYPKHISNKEYNEKSTFIQNACRNTLIGVNNLHILKSSIDEEKELQYKPTDRVLQNNRQVDELNVRLTQNLKEYKKKYEQLSTKYKEKCAELRTVADKNISLQPNSFTTLINNQMTQIKSLRQYNTLLAKRIQHLMHRNTELEQEKKNLIKLNSLYPIYTNNENNTNCLFTIEHDEMSDSSENESCLQSDWEQDDELIFNEPIVDNYLYEDVFECVETTAVAFDESGNVYCKKMQKKIRNENTQNHVVCIHMNNSDSIAPKLSVEAADYFMNQRGVNVYNFDRDIRTAICCFDVVIPSFRLLFTLTLPNIIICYLDNLSAYSTVRCTCTNEIEELEINTTDIDYIELKQKQEIIKASKNSKIIRQNDNDYIACLTKDEREKLVSGYIGEDDIIYHEVIIYCVGVFVGHVPYIKTKRFVPIDPDDPFLYSKTKIFSSSQFIERLNDKILEKFPNDTALFYYVINNTALQFIQGTIYEFRDKFGTEKPILIVNSELHQKEVQDLLYLIVIPYNGVNNSGRHFCHMFDNSMNVYELVSKYNVKYSQLPKPSRSMNSFKIQLFNIKNTIIPVTLADDLDVTKLKFVTSKKKHGKPKLTITMGKHQFIECCKQAIIQSNLCKEPMVTLSINNNEYYLNRIAPIWLPSIQIHCGALSCEYDEKDNQWHINCLYLDKGIISNMRRLCNPMCNNSVNEKHKMFLELKPLSIYDVRIMNKGKLEANGCSHCVYLKRQLHEFVDKNRLLKKEIGKKNIQLNELKHQIQRLGKVLKKRQINP